jgi:hypothetical protein
MPSRKHIPKATRRRALELLAGSRELHRGDHADFFGCG